MNLGFVADVIRNLPKEAYMVIRKPGLILSIDNDRNNGYRMCINRDEIKYVSCDELSEYVRKIIFDRLTEIKIKYDGGKD